MLLEFKNNMRVSAEVGECKLYEVRNTTEKDISWRRVNQSLSIGRPHYSRYQEHGRGSYGAPLPRLRCRVLGKAGPQLVILFNSQ
jgi:hypothetical protein